MSRINELKRYSTFFGCLVEDPKGKWCRADKTNVFLREQDTKITFLEGERQALEARNAMMTRQISNLNSLNRELECKINRMMNKYSVLAGIAFICYILSLGILYYSLG